MGVLKVDDNVTVYSQTFLPSSFGIKQQSNQSTKTGLESLLQNVKEAGCLLLPVGTDLSTSKAGEAMGESSTLKKSCPSVGLFGCG